MSYALSNELRGAVPSIETALSALRSPDSMLGASPWFARMILPERGGALRTIITGRKRHTTGTYVSRKAARSLPYESMVERALFFASEVDTDVVTYGAQPCRFEFELGGQLRSYIPDCIRQLAGGPIEFLEAKADKRHEADADYVSKLSRVAEICGRLGGSFRVITRAELEEPRQRWANVQLVEHHRHVAFSVAEVLRVRQVLAEADGQTALSQLTRLFSSPALGEAKLHAMMVARFVSIDLSARFSPLTPLQHLRL